MIFEQPLCAPEHQDRSADRQQAIGNLLGAFRTCFPTLDFRILDQITVVNAQASISNGSRFVDLFGGLAYHPKIGRDALIFVLLHEAGHHLSSGSRSPWMSELACDCAADAWAVTKGAAELRKLDCSFELQVALSEIERATQLRQRDSSRGARASGCAALHWKERKRLLVERNVQPRLHCKIV
jgi:hypothetical protein